MTLGYLYSKFFKIVLRGKSVLNSQIDKTAKSIRVQSFTILQSDVTLMWAMIVKFTHAISVLFAA